MDETAMEVDTGAQKREDAEETDCIMKRVLRLFYNPAFILLVITIGILLFAFLFQRFAERKKDSERAMYALLSGKDDIEILRIRFYGKDREVDCDDPKVIEYFKQALRGAKVYMGGSGRSYEMRITRACGPPCSVPIYVNNDKNLYLCMPDAGEPGWASHCIEFPLPENKAALQMIDYLSKFQKEIADKPKMVVTREQGKGSVTFAE